MLALHIDETLAEGDLSLSGGVLAEEADLQTMAILSLFCDAPAREGDPVDPSMPRAGYWADAYATDGDQWGSRLWILKRAKCVQATADLAKQYTEEALAWMVSDGIASRIDAFGEIRLIRPGVRGVFFGASVYRPDERTPITAGPWQLEAA